MTLERGAVEAGVKIRVPGHVWIPQLLMGVLFLVAGAGYAWRDQPWFAVLWLTGGGVSVAAALWAARSLGVDLTRESANLHGIRRRSLPWQEVQAVVRYGNGSMGVRLILEDGMQVTLRAPRTQLGFGAAQFERDFQRIDQRWLAHRGESWRPEGAETPPPPVQG
jgi:hypothetical protein